MENKNNKVRNYILTLLEDGEFVAGQKLPGARNIANTLGVSLLTVQNALETLGRDGIVVVEPRQGTFISSEWKNRVLQDSISSFTPWNNIFWSKFYKEKAANFIPNLYFTEKRPHSVFEIVATAEAQFRHNEYINMEDLLKKCISDKSQFYMDKFNSFYYKDKLIGVPILFSPRVMFFNKRILSECNCPIPSNNWQWEDFLEIIRYLLKQLPSNQVFAWSSHYFIWINFVLRAGGALVDYSKDNPVQIDSKNTQKALTLYRQLREELGNNITENSDFSSGNLAFHIGARQTVASLKNNNMTDWGILPLPHLGGCNTSMQATELFCIRKECVNMGMAEKILKLFLSEDFQNHLGELKYAIPIRKSSAEKSFDDKNIYERIFIEEEAITNSQYNLDSVDIFNLVVDGISDLLCSQRSIELETKDLANLVRLYNKYSSNKSL